MRTPAALTALLRKLANLRLLNKLRRPAAITGMGQIEVQAPDQAEYTTSLPSAEAQAYETAKQETLEQAGTDDKQQPETTSAPDEVWAPDQRPATADSNRNIAAQMRAIPIRFSRKRLSIGGAIAAIALLAIIALLLTSGNDEPAPQPPSA